MEKLYLKLKKNIKFKTTFQKLIFSYIVLISVILLTSMLVLYHGYKKQMINESSVVSEKFINQAEYYSHYTMGWARSYIYQLYLDQEIYNLMFSPDNDATKVTSGFLKIKQAATMLPSVQSIYVYNHNTKMVYSSDGNSSSYSLFYDRDILKLIKENTESMSTQFTPRQIYVTTNGQQYKKDILTVLLTNTKADAEGIPYGAIMLNLDANTVQAYFNNMSQDDYNIFAINSSGHVILNSNKDLFLKDVSGLEYIKKILTDKSKKGSFISTIEGKPSIVTFKYDDTLGLFLINIVKYDTLIGSISSMVNLITITFIILFIFGLIFSVFSSRRIYSPIAQTVNTLKQYLNTNNSLEKELGVADESDNDMEYVTKVIDTILNKPISYGKLSTDDLQFIKKQLLKALLLNIITEIEGLKHKLKDIGLEIENRNLISVLFKIDSFDAMAGSTNSDELEDIRNKLCMETGLIASKYYLNEIVIINEDEICLVINTEEEANDELTDRIIDMADKMRSIIHEKLNISLTVALGRYVNNIEDISKSYKAAKDCINYRFKYGLNSILWNKKITDDIANDSKYDENIEQSIFKAVKLGNIDDVETELSRMFDCIEKMAYSDMIISVTQLGINSQKIINNIYHMSKENAYIDVKQFAKHIDNFQTLQEVKQYFLELYRSAISQLKDKKVNRKNDTVESVKKYINQNYSDQLLSLEVIADEMKLSPNYLRVLFKDAEGKSISNYINEIRFDKAKTLLETTDLTAMEVSLKVGFANCNYFYTAFKKHYGISPNQFRNSIKSIS